MKSVAWLVALATLFVSPSLAQDRQRGRPYNKKEIERIIKRLEKNTDIFKKAVDRQLDRSVLDGTKREDRINDRVSDLEKATDRLRNRFDRSDSWNETRSDVENVITEARNLNGLFDRVRAYSRVTSSWIAVKTDINTLAALYELRPVR
jgi:hypothetical protein